MLKYVSSSSDSQAKRTLHEVFPAKVRLLLLHPDTMDLAQKLHPPRDTSSFDYFLDGKLSHFFDTGFHPMEFDHDLISLDSLFYLQKLINSL